ncbi:MAG TPA: TonB-dependent receptor, partial [Chitinophagaceae bacterium]|nr:TonB-dependent receptor [Chitinophagaceae bacterium]
TRRWAFFPSASAGWLLSEEPFIRNKFSFLSNLKLRGSYGLMGEDAGDPFQYLAGYQFSNIAGGYVFNDGVLTNGMVSPGVVNNNLTWVKTKIANIGIDADMWNRAFGFSVDLFQRNRDGLLATRAQSITNTFGASFPQENLNSDLVRGVELSLRHSAQWGPVKIDLGANLTYSRRYLVHTERAPYASSMQKWLDPWGNNRYLGREWGYQYDGVYTSIQQYETAPLLGGSLGNSKNLPGSLRIIDANGDGVINGNDQLPIFWAGQYQGYATNPPLQYGFNVTAGWKNFDLNLLLQGAALFTVFTSPNDVWGYNRYPTIWSRYTDRWHTADPSADPFDPATQWVPGYWPALKSVFTGTTDGLTTDRWRHKANYMRIKSLEIGYNIPARILARFNI